MAKQKKETFNDMLLALQASAITAPLPVATIEERRYFLIVCEGERTEPIYFDYLKSFLPKHLLETVEVIGEGDNTVNIVTKAMAEKAKRAAQPLKPPFDEVWAVFDKDDFPDAHFNRAVQLAGQNGIECGHSNQSFELWYVLHFQYLDTALDRKAYIKILTEVLGFKYTKNSRPIVEYLFAKTSVRNAIKFARMLDEMHAGATAAKACPYTRVYLLVERLLEYAKRDV